MPLRAKPDAPEPAGGVTLFDADGDGDLDLLERRHGRVAALPQRRRPAAERDGPRPRRFLPRSWPAAGAIAGDYDNDGRPDLFLLREGSRRLLHQKADGAFEDVTAAAGLPAPPPVGLGRGVRGCRSRRRPRHRHRRRGRAVAAQQRQRHVHRHHRRPRASAPAPPRRALSIVADRLRQPARHRHPRRRPRGRPGAVPQHARRHVPRRGRRARAAAGRRSTRPSPPATSTRTATPTSSWRSRPGPACSRSATVTGSFARRRRRRRRAPAIAAQFVDYDNDGLLDLLTLSGRTACRLFRNVGGGPLDRTSSDAARLAGRRARRRQSRSRRWRSAISTATATRTSSIRDRRGDAARLEKRRRQPERVAARAARRRASATAAASARRSSCGPAACVRSSKRRRRRRPSRRPIWCSAWARARRPTSSACCGRRASCRRRRPSPRRPRGRVAGDHRDRARSQALVVSVSLHVERHAVRVRDRLHGRRRDGRLGGAGLPGTSPIPTSTCASAAISCGRATAGTSCGSPTSSRRRCSSIALQLVAVDHPGGRRRLPERRPEVTAARRRSPLTAARDARPPARAIDEHGHDVLPQIAVARSPLSRRLRPAPDSRLRGAARARCSISARRPTAPCCC